MSETPQPNEDQAPRAVPNGPSEESTAGPVSSAPGSSAPSAAPYPAAPHGYGTPTQPPVPTAQQPGAQPGHAAQPPAYGAAQGYAQQHYAQAQQAQQAHAQQAQAQAYASRAQAIAAAHQAQQGQQQAAQGQPYGQPAFGAGYAGQQGSTPASWQHPEPGASDNQGLGTGTDNRSSRGGQRWWLGLVAGAVAGALVGGVTAMAVSNGSTTNTVAGGNGPGVVIQNPDSVTAVTAAAAKALPSVVTINVSRGTTGGSGSGIVVDDKGHILTNQHVATLAGATDQGTIDIMTSDGKVLGAKLVGQDPLYDLAVLKVDPAGLTPIVWADLSKLNVGDVAVAIGAPLGLPNSVSDGIVSNLDRSIPVASSAVEQDSSADEDDRFSLPDQDGAKAKGQVSINVIQTDAAINHGNSGGALVNAAGELIGVNVAIYSPSEEGGSIGLGFSVRADIAKRVSDELIKDGKATHGQLGVSISSTQVKDGGTETGFTNGATVADVPADSPAGKAGMRLGDIIVKVGDRRVVDATDVTATVRSYAAVAEVSITVKRSGQEVTLPVTLGAAKVG